MDLSKEQAQMLQLLDIAMHPSKISGQNLKEFDLSNWNEIQKEMMLHTVHVLVSDIIERLPLSQEEQMEYMKNTASNMNNFYSHLIEQENIFNIFEEEGIPCVVLKGVSAALQYPRPEYRCMGDIDLLVYEKDFERASSILLENGYQDVTVRKDNRRHTEFIGEEGIEIELHRYFSCSDDIELNNVFDQQISGSIKERELQEIEGFTFYTLPVLENGLVLLSHINQHLTSGLGLRQIIDWMLFVEKYIDDSFWENEFCPMAETMGMKTLAETSTLLCKEYLGLDNITWCNHADKELAHDLLKYVLKKGNFGRKNKDSNKTIRTIRRFRDPIKCYQYLTRSGTINWKAAQKYKVLVPFAWIYEIGHLIRKGLSRKESFNTLMEETKESKKETELLNRLKVTRV